jgi:hypothetical protein
MTVATRPVKARSSRAKESFNPQPDMWVQLRNLPSAYSHDRALLLCQIDPEHWIAWVPDHGELRLDRQAFLAAET